MIHDDIIDELLAESISEGERGDALNDLRTEAEAVGARCLKIMFNSTNPGLALWHLRRRLNARRKNVTNEWLETVSQGVRQSVGAFDPISRFSWTPTGDVIDTETFDAPVLSAPKSVERKGEWAVTAARDINTAWAMGREK